MKKIIYGWTEQLIETDSMEEAIRYVQRNAGRGYMYYNPKTMKWVLDDVKAVKRNSVSPARYRLHFRKPYGKCNFPECVSEKRLMDLELKNEGNYSEEFISGFYSGIMEAIVEIGEIQYM